MRPICACILIMFLQGCGNEALRVPLKNIHLGMSIFHAIDVVKDAGGKCTDVDLKVPYNTICGYGLGSPEHLFVISYDKDKDMSVSEIDYIFDSDKQDETAAYLSRFYGQQIRAGCDQGSWITDREAGMLCVGLTDINAHWLIYSGQASAQK